MQDKKSKPKSLNFQTLSFEEWHSIIQSGRAKAVLDYMAFPNEKIKNAYLLNIKDWTEKDIRYILRHFLISTCSLWNDHDMLRFLTTLPARERQQRLEECEFLYRLRNYKLPWEGITWVMDLLPDSPRQAIQVIKGYLDAHSQIMPDRNIFGLDDCISVIQARYCEMDHPITILQTLNYRELEILIGALYQKMGYIITVTKKTRDGGKDLIAEKSNIGEKDKLYIECKKWNKPVGIGAVRNLGHQVQREKINKGVLITISSFSKPAVDEAYKSGIIELIEGRQLINLLNSNLGVNWPIIMNDFFNGRFAESFTIVGDSPEL